MFKFGAEEGFLTIEADLSLGYPTYEDFLGTYQKRSTVPKSIWNKFLRFVSSRNIPCTGVAGSHLIEFKRFLEKSKTNKAHWNLFSRQWNLLAAAGLVPAVVLEPYPTRKVPAYAIALADLPPSYRTEIAEAENRLRPESLIGRKGKRRLRKSTLALRLKILLRFLGFLKKLGHDLGSRPSISDWIVEDLLKQYLNSTNRETSAKAEFGKYHKSILLNLEQLFRHGFCSEDKAAVLRDMRLFSRKRFHVRREALKETVTLNEVFTTVSLLLTKANESASACTPHQRALMVRDGLIILFFCMFGYRRQLVVDLEIGRTLMRIVENGMPTYLVLVPQDETKPGLRDGYYEIPKHYTAILDFYIKVARPFLLKSTRDCGILFRAEGGEALSSGAIYEIVVRHTTELIGKRVNPHLLRKALATEWLAGHPRDLLSLSIVMDCNVLTIQKNYARECPEDACAKVDLNARNFCSSHEASAEWPEGELLHKTSGEVSHD